MGMDGISIANTGALKEATSAEHTNRTAQTIANDPTNSSDQVQGLSTNEMVREKDEEEESGGNKQKGAQKETEETGEKEEETFDDGLVVQEETEPPEIQIEDIENPNKDFYVKLNIKDDIIELYDSVTDKMVETISGTELGELVQKLNMASGIFVNKKV